MIPGSPSADKQRRQALIIVDFRGSMTSLYFSHQPVGYGLSSAAIKLPGLPCWALCAVLLSGVISAQPGQPKTAVNAGGFTAHEKVGVALAGQLIDWNGKSALSITSTNRAGKKVKTIYVLKENSQLKRLKASAKASGQEVFITGQASQAPPLGHTDRHPYIVVIETFQVL